MQEKLENTFCLFFQNGKIVAIYTSEEKIPANFDFTWFPFDTQTLVVPQVLGNTDYGIFLPKLLWPTMRKKCSSDREKTFETTRTIYSNNERSEEY